MSLGVLNNLSAVYAENYLNQTNNSLNTVLQQLSSGSKINSGADDAAGLSLVDGLQANQQALNQSETNATEGVGLLQVADGALSQVTSLLNRAVTLATEASNGTLNQSQDTAANQEYQSILSEINNIGATTTYNDEAVFGSNTNIYTGDSSTVGSSIDDLNVRTLSSSNVGDTGGVMAYSSGQNSVFLNLSSSTQNAQSTDALNSNGSSTIDVNYLVKGADGSSTAAQTSITTGGTSGYSNTAGGLISAIDNAGLGLTATFTTAAQAGVTGGGTETGIQISGGLISVGVDPNTASTSGTLNPSEITSGDLTVGQTISVNTGATVAAAVTISQTNDTLTGLANAINTAAENNNGAGGVTATVVYNSAGTATSLQLADNTDSGGALTVTTTPASVVPNELTPGQVVTGTTSGMSFTPGQTGAAGAQGTATLSINGAGTNGADQLVSGSITLMNGNNSWTFATGSGNASDTTYLGNNVTLTDLATAIGDNAVNGLGVTAQAGSSGITITSTATGTNIAAKAGSTLTGQLSAAVTSNVVGLAASAGTDGSTVLSMTGDAMGITGGANSTALTAGTQLTLKNGSGSTYTFTMSASGNGTLSGLAASTQALTAQSLANAINGSTATTGMQATIANGVFTVSSTGVNTTIVATSNLTGAQNLAATSPSITPPADVYSQVNVLTNTGNPTNNSLTGTGDALTGSVTIGDGTNSATFVMGGETAGYVSGTTYDTGADTLASLETAINDAAAGTVAAWQNGSGAGDGMTIAAKADDVAGGTGSGLTLTETSYGPTIAVTGPGISVASSTTFTTPASGSGSQGLGDQYESGTLNLEDGGNLLSATGAASDGVFSGSLTVSEDIVGGGGVVTQQFTMGGVAGASDGHGGVYTGGTTLASLVTAINDATAGTGGFTASGQDVTASIDSATGGLFLQTGATTDTNLELASNTIVDTQSLAAGEVTQGSNAGPAVDTVTNGTSGASTINLADVLTAGGTLTIGNSKGTNSNGTTSVVFTIGAAGATEANDGTDAVTTGKGTGYAGNTMEALVNAINNQTQMDLTATVTNTGFLQITAGGGGTLTVTAGTGASQLSQAYGVGNTAGSNVETAGTGPSSATNAAVSINTGAGMSASGDDALTGQIVLTNSSNNTPITFNLSNSSASSGNVVNLTAGANSTLTGLVNAINTSGDALGLGITASINSTTGALQLQAQGTDTSIAVGGTGLYDNSTLEGLTQVTQAQQSENSTGALTLTGEGAAFNANDALTGSFTVTGQDGSVYNYVMYGTTNPTLTGDNTVYLDQKDSTVTGLINALSSNQNITAAIGTGSIESGGNGGNANQLLLTAQNLDTGAIGISNNSLTDSQGTGAATATTGTFTSESDVLSGSSTMEFSVGNNDYNMASENGGSLAGLTVSQLVTLINYGNTAGTGTEGANGVTAKWVPSATDLTDGANGSNGFGSIELTSNTYGADGNIANYSSGTTLDDTATSATIGYSSNAAYSVGISNVAGTGVYDSSVSSESKPSGTSAAYEYLTSSTGGSSGIATMSYSDGAGVSLSATDLSSQADAEAALTSLNSAITDVAAQDGYIGAQINTLNSVSSVLSTQSENVESAQNAVQATDYATATSDMSKYEILSQTGIAALAQANSQQQEVLKLLQ